MWGHLGAMSPSAASGALDVWGKKEEEMSFYLFIKHVIACVVSRSKWRLFLPLTWWVIISKLHWWWFFPSSMHSHNSAVRYSELIKPTLISCSWTENSSKFGSEFGKLQASLPAGQKTSVFLQHNISLCFFSIRHCDSACSTHQWWGQCLYLASHFKSICSAKPAGLWQRTTSFSDRNTSVVSSWRTKRPSSVHRWFIKCVQNY